MPSRGCKRTEFPIVTLWCCVDEGVRSLQEQIELELSQRKYITGLLQKDPLGFPRTDMTSKVIFCQRVTFVSE